MEECKKINRKLIINVTVTEVWLLHVGIAIIVFIVFIVIIALLFYENHLDDEQTTIRFQGCALKT